MHVLYINEQSVGRVNLWSRSARLYSPANLRISHRKMDLDRRSKIKKIWKSWFFQRKYQNFDFLKNVSPIDCGHPTALAATGSIVFDVLVASCGSKADGIREARPSTSETSDLECEIKRILIFSWNIKWSVELLDNGARALGTAGDH